MVRILQVIHGYPMRYNAGSEVYTQGLAQALAERHDVHVFTRQENAFLPDYDTHQETDPSDPRITLHVVNMARARDGYRHPSVDDAFADLLDDIDPDVVHIGHLNHLSTSLVFEAEARRIPVVFTLHDYWLMCPRGSSFRCTPRTLQTYGRSAMGRTTRKCAIRCYVRYFSGSEEEYEADASHWTDWVGRAHGTHPGRVRCRGCVHRTVQVSLRRFRDDFGIPEGRLTYLDYGFHRRRMEGRSRTRGEPSVRLHWDAHTGEGGEPFSLRPLAEWSGNPLLRVWGRDRGVETAGLKALAHSLPGAAGNRIEWMGEYRNQDIVGDVFNRCDTIVVPTIWAENSPLVIHEALQARVPVITADYGGMAEYVQHERNGMLFAHRDPDSLAQQMQRLADDPRLAERLGQSGLRAVGRRERSGHGGRNSPPKPHWRSIP